jgi:osmotically inducible lipoprotein OsmB
MTTRSILIAGCLALLSACGETRVEKTASGAGIGLGMAALASASLPWGAVLGAGAGYFSR